MGANAGDDANHILLHWPAIQYDGNMSLSNLRGIPEVSGMVVLGEEHSLLALLLGYSLSDSSLATASSTFWDKTFEFVIQTWQTSLEHYYVYVYTYFLSQLSKMLVLLIRSHCRICPFPTMQMSRVCIVGYCIWVMDRMYLGHG